MRHWWRLRSNQVTVLEMEGGPANDDHGHHDQEDAEAGQSSGERPDRGGSPSRAGAGHRGQMVELDPSLLQAGVRHRGQTKHMFRLESNQVIEMQVRPENNGSELAHNVFVSRAMTSSGQDVSGPRDQAGAAAGQISEERQDRGGLTLQAGAGHRAQAAELPNYAIEEADSCV